MDDTAAPSAAVIGRALDEFAVVGLDLATMRPLTIRQVVDRRTIEERGYNGDGTIVCLYCYYGVDAAPGTLQPILYRGRVGGVRRHHFAHPPGTFERHDGHSPESRWHLETKVRLMNWLLTRDNVTVAAMERWTPDRSRRSDVRVSLTSGTVVALEVQTNLIQDAEWETRHADYRRQGVVDIWFVHSQNRTAPGVLLDLGVQVLTIGDADPSWLLGHGPHGALMNPPRSDGAIEAVPVALDDLRLADSGALVMPEVVRSKIQRSSEAAEATRLRVLADAQAERARLTAATPTPADNRPAEWPRKYGIPVPACLRCGGPLDLSIIVPTRVHPGGCHA